MIEDLKKRNDTEEHFIIDDCITWSNHAVSSFYSGSWVTETNKQKLILSLFAQNFLLSQISAGDILPIDAVSAWWDFPVERAGWCEAWGNPN